MHLSCWGTTETERHRERGERGEREIERGRGERGEREIEGGEGGRRGKSDILWRVEEVDLA